MEINLEDLKATLQDFVVEREWQRFHEPKDLALAISIENGELSEHFLWKNVEEARDYVKNEDNMAKIVEEIADVMIYSLNLVNALERISETHIDIGEAILAKIEKNAKKYPATLYRNKARLDKP
ncbi:MAG TPA: nucleotide pyrophosphohydrolase [Candidatus Lokiarchaeia archaeon]|nr:nucleotide pyrophosphohydrolase [Candidatus Lokiarchaeia archaeon]